MSFSTSTEKFENFSKNVIFVQKCRFSPKNSFSTSLLKRIFLNFGVGYEHLHSVNDSRLLLLQDKLYIINIIRDIVMQLNFTHLPKTRQYSKHMVASQTSWL